MLCDKAYRLSPHREHVDPCYLEAVLNAPRVQAEIERQKSGINDSGLNLTQKRFLSIKVWIPSLDQQAEIVRILDERLSAADALGGEIEAGLKRADALRQSILTEAFAGRLVPQNPDDEPATVLLERIRTEREAKPKAKRRRRATKSEQTEELAL